MSSTVCALSMYSRLCMKMLFFSVSTRMCNATYVIFIMWNSISGLDACYHFQFNISCGVGFVVRGHKKKSGNF